MQTTKSNNNFSKVTSYHQFFDKMAKQKSTKKVTHKNNSNLQKFSPKPNLPTKSINNNQPKNNFQSIRCPTEFIQQHSFDSKLIDLNPFNNRCSNNISNQFTSIQHSNDITQFESFHHISNFHQQSNQQNLYSIKRSCQKRKCNQSFTTQKSFDLKKTYRKNQGMAHYLLNQLSLVIRQISKFNRDRITYLDYLQILRQLNLIQNNYEPSKQDNVNKLWMILSDRQNTTCLINLSVILLAVMNIRANVKSIKDFFENLELQNIKPSNISFKKVGAINKHNNLYKKNKDGYFDLSKENIAKIYKQFKQLRITRMHLGKINKKSNIFLEKSLSINNHSFCPQISQRSKSLAKIKRDKMHNCQSVSYHDFMQYRAITDRQKKEQQQCTFHPNILKTYHKQNSQKSDIRRTQLLYQLAKSKSKQKKDRCKEQIQLQKYGHLCTFKPNLVSKKKIVVSKNKKKVEGENKQLDRMLKARFEKQLRYKVIQKGIPFNQKQVNKLKKIVTQQLFTKSTQKKKPAQSSQNSIMVAKSQENIEKKERKQIFTFEVYLQQDTCFDKITVYEGDNIEEIAHNFIIQHNLKEQMEGKLINSLKNNLAQLNDQDLGKIQQQSIQYSIQI